MLLDLKVRDVCIQDPRRETAYLIPAAELRTFAQDSVSDDLRAGAVTFTVSYDSLLDTVPEPVRVASAEPNVIIRDGDAGEEYYLTFAQLQQFRVGRPELHPVAKTFTLPMTEALVEEMPAAVKALLQTDVAALGLGPARRS